MDQVDGGLTLKAIRVYLGLTQEEFARLIGTTATTVSRRERQVGGEPMLTLGEVLRLQKALSATGKELGDFVVPAPTQTQNA